MLAPSFYRCLVAIVSACLAFSFLSPAPGQTTTSNFRDALNSKPFPPATDQELINPYWTTDTGWKTELQLRHNQQSRSLTVAPALRRPDGRETSLTSINVKTQEAKSIYLDSAIGISVPQLVGTGSVVVRYHPASPTNIYAVSMVGAVGLSTAFHLGCQGRISPSDWQPRRHLVAAERLGQRLPTGESGGHRLELDLSLSDALGKASIQKLVLEPVPQIAFRFAISWPRQGYQPLTKASEGRRQLTQEHWTHFTSSSMKGADSQQL